MIALTLPLILFALTRAAQRQRRAFYTALRFRADVNLSRQVHARRSR